MTQRESLLQRRCANVGHASTGSISAANFQIGKVVFACLTNQESNKLFQHEAIQGKLTMFVTLPLSKAVGMLTILFIH